LNEKAHDLELRVVTQDNYDDTESRPPHQGDNSPVAAYGMLSAQARS